MGAGATDQEWRLRDSGSPARYQQVAVAIADSAKSSEFFFRRLAFHDFHRSQILSRVWEAVPGTNIC